MFLNFVRKYIRLNTKSNKINLTMNIRRNSEERGIKCNDLKLCCALHKEGRNEQYVTLLDNVLLFLIRGEINMSVGGYKRKTFDEGQVIFLPRYASCRISLGDDTLLVYVSFGSLKDQRNLSLFNYLRVEYPALYPAYPCIAMNRLMKDYIYSIKHLLFPFEKNQQISIPEYDLFMQLSCCYERKELALLFSPILNNKELIM